MKWELKGEWITGYISVNISIIIRNFTSRWPLPFREEKPFFTLRIYVVYIIWSRHVQSCSGYFRPWFFSSRPLIYYRRLVVYHEVNDVTKFYSHVVKWNGAYCVYWVKSGFGGDEDFGLSEVIVECHPYLLITRPPAKNLLRFLHVLYCCIYLVEERSNQINICIP